MAATSVTRKQARANAASKRASTIAREAMKTADRLTLKVLEGGRSGLAATKQAPPAKKKKKKAEAESNRPLMARTVQVAPPGFVDDATPQLAEAAPAFGDVLKMFGDAIAVAQTALDDTALASLKTLAGQQVDVPILIEQTLNNDGTPGAVNIRTASVPLATIIRPSMQMVKSGTFRMDMDVQSFDQTSGVRFNQNMASAGFGFNRHQFGFAVAMNNTNVNAQFSDMSDFSTGSVMMSVDIVDRTGFEIPEPVRYGIGANLFLRLVSLVQTTSSSQNAPPTFTRKATLSINLVRTDGSIDNPALTPADYDVVATPGLLFNKGTGSFTVETNPGAASDPYTERKIIVTFGQLNKQITIYI